MVIAKDPTKCKLAVYENSIHQCKQCTYLGVEIRNAKILIQEVRAYVNKVLKTFGYLRYLIWKKKYISTDSKVRLYKIVVRPKLTYAVKTLADTTKRKNMMKAAEIKTLRTIRGVSLSVQIRIPKYSRDLEDDIGETTSI